MIIYLAILVLGFTLFSREIFPLEISALLILCLLVLSGILTKQEAFSSFGNESLILIGSLFIMIAALNKTGIIKKIEQQILRFCGTNRNLSFVLILVLVAVVSAFVSNTATLAVTIPIIVSIAESYGESPRRWLMPIAFASVLGGMNSLVGTSTNIIISSLLPEYGLEEFSLFTTAQAGLPILIVGLIYLVVVSPFVMAKGEKEGTKSITRKYDMRSFTAEIIVLEDSPLVNQMLSQTKIFQEADVTVLGIIRPGRPQLYPRATFTLHAGDRLVVEGNIEKLTDITEEHGLQFDEERKALERDKSKEDDSSEERSVVEFHEVLVTASSILNNSTPAEVYLRNRYRISLIAVNRQGVTIRQKLSTLQILAGDILLVQFIGPVDLNTLDYLSLIPLKSLQKERRRTKRAPLAAVVFIGALMIGSITSVPLAISCLSGAILMVIFGILKSDEIYEAIEWKVLLFIGAVLCLGKGMTGSGTAEYLAQVLSTQFATLDPTYSISFFFIITVVMTSLLSNQATAVVMIPLAISTAGALGLEPMPFVMSVTIAASCCFLTPFEPAFMLVYGPGGYKFSDFFKLGFILNILAVAIAICIIPVVWGF